MPEKPSQLEQATKDVWCHTMEELAMRESGTQSVAPSQATPSPPREGLQEDQSVDRPHKFEPGPGWTKVSDAGGDAQGSASYMTLAEYDKLDKELGWELVKNVLGHNLTEHDEAMETLIQVNSQKAGVTLGTADIPMDTQLDSSTRTFYQDITERGYHPTLCNSQEPPSSPVTTQEDRLLDQPESLAR